jgi:hypothetical protein
MSMTTKVVRSIGTIETTLSYQIYRWFTTRWWFYPSWSMSINNSSSFYWWTQKYLKHCWKWLITMFITTVRRRVPLVYQELFMLPKYMSSTPVLLRLMLLDLKKIVNCFVDRCLSFCLSIYGFWLPFWYLLKYP